MRDQSMREMSRQRGCCASRREATKATVKIIELVGVSTKSWHDAVEEALKEPAKALHGINGIGVVSTTAMVKDKKITQYRANVKIAFVVEKGRA